VVGKRGEPMAGPYRGVTATAIPQRMPRAEEAPQRRAIQRPTPGRRTNRLAMLRNIAPRWARSAVARNPLV
jgi:hypothetical protein